MEGAVADKKEKNEEKKKKLESLKAVQNEENALLRQIELDYEKNSSDFSNADNSLKGVRKNLEEKEE